MTARRSWPLALALLAAGCGGHAAAPDGLHASAGYASYEGCARPCPAGGVPSALRRPLHLPRLRSGATCPTSATRTVGFAGRVAGPGPVYPVEGSQTLPFDTAATAFAGSAWRGEKVLWVASARYGGPVLIRARRLDGPQAAGFGNGLVPVDEMQLRETGATSAYEPAGWREWPSFTRVQDGGCYGYQVDGTDFSAVIVFRAAPP
jgi:hypothetical protein